MNGRVYDPTLGRFASADPFIQAPENTQSLNRYSYVLNNPLSMSDPSGFFFKRIFKSQVFRIFAAVTLAYVLGPQGPLQLAGTAADSAIVVSTELAAGYVNSAIAGFSAGLAGSGGNLKMGIIGAFTASAFHFVGHSPSSPFSGEGLSTALKIGKIVAHGVVGGVSSQLSSGEFLSGFLSAGFTQAADAAGLFIEGIGANPYNAVVAAVVGGTASVLGGGKFGNGALTGTFSRLFNDEASCKICDLSPEAQALIVDAVLTGATFLIPVTGGIAAVGFGYKLAQLGYNAYKLHKAKKLIGTSNKALKHAKKHLSEFQDLDPNMNVDRLIDIGKTIAANKKNRIKFRGLGDRDAFQAEVMIGKTPTKVRVVLNEAGNLRSISIRR